MSYCDLSLTFDLHSVRLFSTVIIETYFSCDNDIWIAANDYYLCRGSIISMTVCLSVSLSVCMLAGLWKYYYLDLPEKKSEDESNLAAVNFLE